VCLSLTRSSYSGRAATRSSKSGLADGLIPLVRKASHDPADAIKTLRLEVVPWTTHTVVVVSLESRNAGGRSHSVLARWHLRLTRADLAGHGTDDVLRAVIQRLLHRLDSSGDPADYQAAVGIGVPLGTTGGNVTTDPPGLVESAHPPGPGM
jgi:hypothetical protein